MYRLVGRLESGELSELYRADRDGEQVVIKLFHPRTSDSAYAKVVTDVALKLRGVAHPGLAHVLEVGTVQRRLAIVREEPARYSLGQALQRLNTREVYLPPTVALAFVIDLLDVLQVAHGAGVVHGALTPGNVLLTEGGRAAVADFGALTALMASPALKKAFGGRGRNSYRAPELKNSAVATVASDLYAAGAITYELLTMREASTGSATMSTRSEKLPAPSRLVRSLNSRIDPVIMRALEPAASRRYKSCADYAQGLRDFLVANGGLPSSDDVARFVSELFPKDMIIDGLGPPAFTTPFKLEDIDGVEALPDFGDDTQQIVERQSFSKGQVTERTPTSDGLPVFEEDTASGREQAKTETGVQAVQAVAGPRINSWVAPAGEMPQSRKELEPVAPADHQRRFKVVEDFGAEKAEPAEAEEAAPAPRKVAKTVVNYVTSFQRQDVPQIPRYSDLEKRSRLRSRIVAALGTMILITTGLSLSILWYLHTPDPKAELLRMLPEPFQREFGSEPSAHPPQPPNKRVKLPDFDKPPPHKDSPPDKPPPAVDKPKVVESPPPPPGCHQPPKPPVSYLGLEGNRLKVEIDGLKVCGALGKIPVAPGLHKVRVVDLRSGQEYVAQGRYEVGKINKVVPVFKR